MEFGPFVLLSLFYAVIGVRFVFRLIGQWRETFDRRFTEIDRAMVDQAAFFILVPVSVALHEFGHAIAIWLLGGTVQGWGYYLFAGYVSFDPTEFSRDERVLIVIAGTIVNVLLAGLALLLVFGRRRPMRAAFNEMLVQFTVLSLGNALIVYPALDLTSGLNGDWTQVYRGGVPALAAAIFAVHAAILIGGVLALRSERVGARIASLTGLPGGARRAPLGGVKPGAAGAAPDRPTHPTDQILRDAIDRVVSGWPTQVEAGARRSEASLFVLSWFSGGLHRSVVIWRSTDGAVEIAGAAGADDGNPHPRPVAHEPAGAGADRLTLALRLAMETVETWAPTGDTAPGTVRFSPS